MQNEIRYFSMFTGVGGFELGLERANNPQPLSKVEQDGKRRNGTSNKQGTLLCSGQKSTFRCVGQSEIDKYASQLLKNKFPGIKNYGDATKIEPSQLPDFDMLCGGFPCQAFSIAGKRKGFEDIRGTMFLKLREYLKLKDLKLYSLKTSKAYSITTKGKLLESSFKRWMNWGMKFNGWYLTANFSEFPRTERGYSLSEVLEESLEQKYFLSEKACATLLREYKKGEFPPYLQASYGKRNARGPHLQQIIPGGQGNRVYSTEGTSTTIASQAGGRGAKTGLYAVLTPDRENKRQSGRRFKEPG